MDGGQEKSIALLDYQHYVPKKFDDISLLCCECARLLSDPMHQPCGHDICRRCLKKIVFSSKGIDVTCPSCGNTAEASSIIENVEIAEHVLKARGRILILHCCTPCRKYADDYMPAVAWCATCRYRLCDECEMIHGKYFRMHNAVKLDDIRFSDNVLQMSKSQGRFKLWIFVTRLGRIFDVAKGQAIQ